MTNEAGISKALSADCAGPPGAVSSVGRSADSRDTVAGPGKTTLSAQVSATQGAHSFDTMHRSAWNRIAALSRSISAADFLCAWSAANDLLKGLAGLEALVSEHPDTKAEKLRRLGELRSVADPLLALAPRPTPAALQEAASTERRQSRATWSAEERQWRGARGGPAASVARARPNVTFESAASETDGSGARLGSWLAAFTHHGLPPPGKAVQSVGGTEPMADGRET